MTYQLIMKECDESDLEDSIREVLFKKGTKYQYDWFLLSIVLKIYPKKISLGE